MNKKELSKWLRTILWLKKEFTPQKDVIVRTIPMTEDDGKASYHTPRFWIRNGKASYNTPYFWITISRKIDYSARIDSLLHEWAHILTWHGYDASCGEDHGGEWGLAHAKIYDAWVKWNYGEDG